MDIKQISINISILVVASVFIPFFFPLFLSFLKINKLKTKTKIYMHAFSAGLLLIVATLGLINEANEKITEDLEALANNFNSNGRMWIRVMIIGFGILIGLLFAIGNKSLILFLQKNKKKHDFCAVNLSEIMHYEHKKTAIIAIAAHKFVDGLSLGLTVQNLDFFNINTLGTRIGLIIHEIPIVIIMYYLQVNGGLKKPKALLYILIYGLITVPFIIIGVLINYFDFQNLGFINYATFWIIPFAKAFAGAVLLFAVLMDIIPEFLHNNHICNKHWYLTALMLVIGIGLGVFLEIGLSDAHGH